MVGSFITAIILSVVILLLDHPIKYVLYFFGLTLTGILFLIIRRYNNYKFELAIPISYKIVDYLFLMCTVTVLISNIFANSIVNVNFIPSIIISFFLPGWALLRVLKIDSTRTNIDSFVLSFCISIGLSSVIFLFSLIFMRVTVAAYISIYYICKRIFVSCT